MPEKLEPGWKRVKFGDVVRQVKDKVDPATSGLERYIAGEHMDTDDLRLRRWGTIGDDYLGPAFHMRFKPGQVLYGSRRTYLRKVAVADFEGICANTTFVLEPKDPQVLLPEYLPFLMQTEAFHEHSKRESKGSVNPYVNFSDLAWWELALPPIQEQQRLLQTLRAAEAVRTARDSAAAGARAVLRSAIDQALGVFGPESGSKVEAAMSKLNTQTLWPFRALSDVTTQIVDGVHKRPEYVDEGIPFITVENLTRGPSIDFSSTRFVSRSDHISFARRARPESGDVLVSKDGTLGVARVVETSREFSIFVSVALLKPNRMVLDPWFLKYFFDSSLFLSRLAGKTSGSALKHIHLVDFRRTMVPVPPLADQQRIVDALRSIDSASQSASDAVLAVRALQKRLLRELGEAQ